MLILSRRPGESIRIGADIRIICLRIRGNQVSFGIEAPLEVVVDREEVYMVKQARAQIGTVVPHAGAVMACTGAAVPRSGVAVPQTSA